MFGRARLYRPEHFLSVQQVLQQPVNAVLLKDVRSTYT